MRSKAWFFSIHLKIDLVFSSRVYPLIPSGSFLGRGQVLFSNTNIPSTIVTYISFFDTDIPSPIVTTISIAANGGRGAMRRGPSIEIRDVPRKRIYNPFCTLCILDHSTVLCFLVVKSFVVANDDLLRMSFKIL